MSAARTGLSTKTRLSPTVAVKTRCALRSAPRTAGMGSSPTSATTTSASTSNGANSRPRNSFTSASVAANHLGVWPDLASQ